MLTYFVPRPAPNEARRPGPKHRLTPVAQHPHPASATTHAGAA